MKLASGIINAAVVFSQSLHIATLGPAVFFAAHANEILRTMTLIGTIKNSETQRFMRGEVQFFDYEILSA